MSVIERLAALVAEEFPDRRCTVSDRKISVEAPSPEGFSVWFSHDQEYYTVGYDGWHEHLDSLKQAVKRFEFGLKGRCRLKVEWCGGFPYRWTLEYPSETGWTADSETGLLLFPFWRRRRITYLQNQASEPE